MKIVIPGQFWDSQIYFGRLYLFGLDGSVRTVRWNNLIEQWPIDEKLAIALKCAFSESDFLYGHQAQRITHDTEIRRVIQDKFESLGKIPLELDDTHVSKFLAGHQDSPFPFPHADSFVFKKNFFTASKKGIHQASCGGQTNKPISKLVKKHTDHSALNISLKYNTIAFAAGEEGLFELYFGDSGIRGKGGEPRLLTEGNFSSCNWLFWSIYGTSYSSSSMLIDFEVSDLEKSQGWPDDEGDFAETSDLDFLDSVPTRSGKRQRTLKKVLSDHSIFNARGISWGNQDKLCLVNGNTLHIVKYDPWAEKTKDRLRAIRTVDFDAWKGEITSGSIAHFGTIVECDQALVIIPTEGNPITLPGECVNWRVFPRAINYVNQLHVIYDDRLEIHSFNHDYFVDQGEKSFGIWHHTGGSRRKSTLTKKII